MEIEIVEQQTQEQIVYQVLNHLTGGLQGITNHPFSVQQIADEIDNLRLEIIMNPKIAPSIDWRQLQQSITCLEVIKVPDQECEDIGSTEFKWRSKDKIPTLLSFPGQPLVSFIGSANWMEEYKLIDSERLPYIKYDKYPMPTAVWIDNYFYFKLLPANTKVLSLRAVFERPSAAMKNYVCCKENSYPIPGQFISRIVNTLVENYKKTPYFANPQPNTQTNLPQGTGGSN